MRILYLHRTRSADGQFVHIRSLVEALRAEGAEVLVVGPDDGDVDKNLDANDGDAGLAAHLPKPVYELAEFGYSAPFFLKARAAARAFRPDVVYERANLHAHAGVWLRRVLKAPLILEVNAPLAEERARHGGLGLGGFARWSEAAVWKNADAVLPVTEVLARKVAGVIASRARTHVVPNGVEAAFLGTPDSTPVRKRYDLGDGLVLGFTGFVRDWHGLDRAVRLLAERDMRHATLLVVGDGPARHGLEIQAAADGVSDRVIFTGVVQRDEIPGHVAAFDVALQPAVTAYASPLKLFEYMALGRAVAAPDTENIREVAAHDRDALLFDADDPEAFAAAVRRLAGDAELRARLGGAARDRIRAEKRTWAGNAQRVLALAEELLAARGES